jgi:hypothetical protein
MRIRALEVSKQEVEVRFTGTPAAIAHLKRGLRRVLTNRDYSMTLSLAGPTARKTRGRKTAA